MIKWVGWCLLVVCTLIFNRSILAQGYNTALGIRLGQDMGFTIQHRLGKKTTIEGISQYNRRYEESRVTLLIQSHKPILFKRLNIYTGAGPHYMWSQNRETQVDPSAGVTLSAGFEIAIGSMNISWDYKPLMNISGGQTGFQGASAISVRYVLFKRKKRNKSNLIFWKSGKNKKQRQKNKNRKRASSKKLKV
jgi:hypothetical protein